MKNTWVKPELKELDIRLTANEVFAGGTDTYYDGIDAPAVISDIISAITGSENQSWTN